MNSVAAWTGNDLRFTKHSNAYVRQSNLAEYFRAQQPNRDISSTVLGPEMSLGYAIAFSHSALFFCWATTGSHMYINNNLENLVGSSIYHDLTQEVTKTKKIQKAIFNNVKSLVL